MYCNKFAFHLLCSICFQRQFKPYGKCMQLLVTCFPFHARTASSPARARHRLTIQICLPCRNSYASSQGEAASIVIDGSTGPTMGRSACRGLFAGCCRCTKVVQLCAGHTSPRPRATAPTLAHTHAPRRPRSTQSTARPN